MSATSPVHLPDLCAIRFTTIAQCAHGRGEPGGKGAVLADALAAPKGMSLVSVFSPRKGMFDSELVEPGPPAILRDDGIIFIYNSKNKWCHGANGACRAGENDPALAPGTQ